MNSVFAAVAVFAVLLSLVEFAVGGLSLSGGTGWEYTGPLGPGQWHNEYLHCGGRMQSPINIDTADVLFDPKLRLFDLSTYDTCKQCTMELENVNGHTAEVKYTGDSIFLRGGSLPDDYILDQFHFHWGGSNEKGSEHKLDNQAFPLEMHIVHHMKKYNRTESASKPYGLALGRHNKNFFTLLSHFKDIVHKDQHVELEPFALASLLPPNARSYFRYYGSLTTPPCYETVIWTIFAEKIEISEEQLAVFRTLKTLRDGESEEVSISNDFRPVQDLHERRVTSNSRKVMQDLASQVVDRLLGEIKDLKEHCPDNGVTCVQAQVTLASLWLGLAVCLGRTVLSWL
ncbi:hypothetical protein ACOMHN_052676 [Nucella lapillus]